MKCSVCNENEAMTDKFLGIIPCMECQERRSRLPSPNPVEFTTEQIKSDRIKYKDYIVQPFRDGVLSKEYLAANGTKGIKVTKEDIKNAKEVWK